MHVTLGQALAVPDPVTHDESREEKEQGRRRRNARRLAPRCATFCDLLRRPICPEYRLSATHERIGRRLTPTEIKVYGLVRAALRGGFAGVQLSQREIADLVGCATSSVGNAVRTLAAAKLINHVPQFVRDYGCGSVRGWRQVASCLVIGKAGRAPSRSRALGHSRKRSAPIRIITGSQNPETNTHPLSGCGESAAPTSPTHETGEQISNAGGVESVSAAPTASAGPRAGSRGTPGAAERAEAIAAAPVAAVVSEADRDTSTAWLAFCADAVAIADARSGPLAGFEREGGGGDHADR